MADKPKKIIPDADYKRLMPKFRAHVISESAAKRLNLGSKPEKPAESKPAPKKAAATNAPIQISVGKRGAKKWRKGNGPWQYGEPPKPDKPAKKTSAEMKDPVLRKDHSEPPKDSVKGSASKGSSSGLMAKMKVTKKTPPEDGKGTVGSKPTIDPIAAAKLKEVRGSFVVGEKPNAAVSSLMNKLNATRPAPSPAAVEKAIAHVERYGKGFREKTRIEPYRSGDGVMTHAAIDPIDGTKVHLGHDRWGSLMVNQQR